jgi:hypothetical protein
MEQTAFRVLAALLALFAALNGARMVADPIGWFASIPDLALTGAANAHLIRDVGVAYLASAAGLGAAAFWPRVAAPLLLAPAIFMGGHALTHLADIAAGCAAAPGGTATDWLGVILPGALTGLLCVWGLRFRQA